MKGEMEMSIKSQRMLSGVKSGRTWVKNSEQRRATGGENREIPRK